MPRGRRSTARPPRRGTAARRAAAFAPAVALAGAGAAFGQVSYGQPQYAPPAYGQPAYPQQAYAQPEIAPPPAPAPMTPEQRRVLDQQRAARTAPPRPVQAAPVRQTDAAGPALITVLGAVDKPRTFEFDAVAPTLGALLERAGGLTGASDRTVRVIRGGRPLAKVAADRSATLDLAPGDVVVADAVPGGGPRERGVSHVALVGVADRPVVLAVPEAKASLATMLPMMGLDARFAAQVSILHTARVTGTLPDGAVLVFPEGTVTNQDWDAYADLVPEPAAQSPTVADFAPIPPEPPREPAREEVAAAPVLRPARRAVNRSAAPVPPAGPTPAASPAAEPVVSGTSEPLSLPAMPEPRPATATASAPAVPAPPPGVVDGPDETLVVDLLDAPPADPFGNSGNGYGTGLGEAEFGDLALLPAPEAADDPLGDSPFYGDDAALAATDAGLNDSHLIALPDPGYAPPGLAAPTPPGGVDPMRVATLPTPGVMRDSPRSAPSPAAPAAPRPLGEGGRPVAAPVPPPIDLPGDAPRISAEPATDAETAEAGVPWVTIGFAFGALAGGLGAAFVALRRRTAALVNANRRADAVSAAPPEMPQAAVRRAADRAAAADRRVLDDLLADRLPLREEAVVLPENVALHGATAGKSKLRLDAEHPAVAAPHFARSGALADAKANADAAHVSA